MGFLSYLISPEQAAPSLTMAQAATSGPSLGAGTPSSTPGSIPISMPPNAMLDMFIPGFSVFSDVVQRYLHVDVNLYIPMFLVGSGLVFAWKYLSEYLWGLIQTYLMSSVDIRPDDELYNYIMAWVASQNFSKDSRRFIANTSLSSRSWWNRWDRDGDEDDDGVEKKTKPLAYTPTYGTHYFWHKGRLLTLKREQNRDQAIGYFSSSSDREEVRVSCFGRNPWIIKELLNEARETYMKRDESKTLIYRGTTKGGGADGPEWQRCMARTSRPFSTVILNEKVKKDLIDDVTDYLNPATRRWYSNRGIPYRRGYLLYGPPGTGKSSLSLALAGFFKMRIYIVSLSSMTANEENLSSLFAELPRRCVVLLEDIDTAGLTHTREGEQAVEEEVGSESSSSSNGGRKKKSSRESKNGNNGQPNTPIGRLSLSGLLNILDGVASQEGRVLIMTTNHVEKLDKALIRPGRVDMIVKFDKADRGMTAAIFKAIYARLEGDDLSPTSTATATSPSGKAGFNFMSSSARAAADQEAKDKQAEKEKEEQEEKQKKDEAAAQVEKLAELFADRIPAHEFSPAEIQGYLLKNKRDPDRAVAGAGAWVVETRKEKMEKELQEAEDKRKAEEEEKKKKKEEEEEKEKEKEDKKKKKKGRSKSTKGRRTKPKGGDDESDKGSGSEESESESESEEEAATTKKNKGGVDAGKKAVEEEGSDQKVEISIVVSTEASNEKSEDGIVEEAKHGGDSGYGTP
jgi:chaperone BCS1